MLDLAVCLRSTVLPAHPCRPVRPHDYRCRQRLSSAVVTTNPPIVQYGIQVIS